MSRLLFLSLFCLPLTSFLLFFLSFSCSRHQEVVFYWLYISAYIVQLIPVIVLTFFITFSPTVNDGPSKLARYILLIGTLFFCSVFAPTSIMTDWFVRQPCEAPCSAVCPFYIGSWVDFLQWVKTISLILYFLFIRSEYKRNMEVSLFIIILFFLSLSTSKPF